MGTKPTPQRCPRTPATGLSSSTGPLCPARKAGILEGHPGRETAGQNLKLVLVVVGRPHPALNPSKPPEGPPSSSSSGGKRSRAEWGRRQSRAGTLGHSEWLPAPEPSAQNRAQSRLWSGEGKHLSFFFFSSKNKNYPPPTQSLTPHQLKEGLLLPPTT